MSDDCPECGTEMEWKSAGGRDHKGRDVGVSWERCPDCGTLVDDLGNVSTPEDQEHALEEARQVARSITETDHPGGDA